tara:strand:+ start:461 stop:706 length:246 start_codon:yes stop_codon:yes gene_type:complete
MRILLLLTFILLANCSSYKPLINPETSKDKYSGNVIAGNYWKDLQACNYIFKENTGKLAILPDKRGFITKCMNDYGYSILR